MQITVYGDFNCPYSRLASDRVDALIERRTAEVDWRAVQHDADMPDEGVRMEGEARGELAEEVDNVRELTLPGEDTTLEIPDVRPNTAKASRVYASVGSDLAHDVRRGFFDAVWARGAPEFAGPEDGARADEWQNQWMSFENRMVPLLVEPDGRVERGVDALKRLAELLDRET